MLPTRLVRAAVSPPAAVVAAVVLACAGLAPPLGCVGDGNRPEADTAGDAACADRCAEQYGNVPPCFSATWSTATCTCTLAPADDGAPCSDGNACTLEDRCADQRCVGALVDLRTYCDDGNACTSDNCDQNLGCVHDPVDAGARCDDGNICTFDSACNALGECRWTDQYVCGVCDPNDPLACADENRQQNPCDGRLACSDAGFCEVDRATVPRCDDPRLDPCQVPSCEDGECAVTELPDGTPCRDGSVCTEGDTCRGGVCTGTPVDVPACACAATEDCEPLDDGDRCDGTLRCRGGTCLFDRASIVVCDASADTGCTANACIPKTGRCERVVAPDEAACDDGDPCTLDDACAAGACLGAARDCSELDGRCLVGVCDRLFGCTAAIAEPGAACVPNVPCARAGVCDTRGDCAATGPSCSDGDPCTLDACDEARGACVFRGPDKPPCARDGVCAAGVGYVCERGEYLCDYAAVPGWSAVERCDARDDDCDGATDEDCIAAEACAAGALVEAWSGTMQACGGLTSADDARCGSGWHVCGYDAMVDALAGDAPPTGFFLAASIVFEPGFGYRLGDGASDGGADAREGSGDDGDEDGAGSGAGEGGATCFERVGTCGGAREVQAMTLNGVFAGAIAYAAEAPVCDGVTAVADCAALRFDGVMCCADACDEDADCLDDSPCTRDVCVAGTCQHALGVVPTCSFVGVCAGLEVTCGADGELACGYARALGWEPFETRCDGLDNDCDGATDGDDDDLGALGVPCEKQAGVCAGATKGSERCGEAGLGACETSDYTAHAPDYEAGLETLCDGRDNDCDGTTDGGFAWEGKRLGQACDGVGACGAGVVECAPSRAAATCSTNPLGSASQASAERCNGADDDCDGDTDEAADLDVRDAGCGTAGVCAGLTLARCTDGAWRCDTDGLAGYGPERCDGLDNDCDGARDDGFVAPDGKALGAPCGPASCPNGVVICAADGASAGCSLDLAPGFERCDAIDNDCDGQTDEGILYMDRFLGERRVGQPCSGLGACGAGTVECGSGGAATCSTLADGTASEARAEQCDGEDDDCDGQTDEGFALLGQPLGAPCSAPGRCGDGVVVCSTDPSRATCSTAPDGDDSDALPEACNGEDDDCDGQTDEGVTPGPGDCPDAGVCRPEMLRATCAGLAGWTCDFSASPYYMPSEAARCDGLDNDCDGTTDEGFAALGEACDGADPDACARGRRACDPSDATKTVCLGDAVVAESCNGVDDDCDGDTDEAGASGCTSFYRDGDGDGFGAGEARCACGPGGGFTADDADDCDDDDERVHPDAPERCNGHDDDCDQKVDAADPADLLVDDATPCEAQAGVCAGVLKPPARCEGGQWRACVAADYAAAKEAYQSKETRCDGLDNDCDGAKDAADPDAVQSPPPCELQAGVCAGADKPAAACGEAGWAACTTARYLAKDPHYEAGTELSCDGRDNECDGLVDDDFAWGGKKVGQSCDGTGACGFGVVECTGDGRGATCSTNPDGAQHQDHAETCNGLDDDCDGQTDEGLVLADSPCRRVGVCTPDKVAASCSGGQWRCDYGAVAGYEAPAELSCDDKDNDCDGATDEDFTLTVAGQTLHKGDVCGATGCNGVVVCNAVTPAPGDLACSSSATGGGEICDGRDNDCDGQTDEGLAWTEPPSSSGAGGARALGQSCDGTGACGSGVVECNDDGAATCSTEPDGSASAAAAEVCNRADDDCDGTTDDGFAWSGSAVGAACDGVGACGAGVVECRDAATATCSTNPNGSRRQDVPETCNGKDDDCDGQTDEGLGLADSTCRTVGVCAQGTVVATCGGTQGWACSYQQVPGYHANNEQGFCDGRDNDCDGQTDEDNPEVGAACDGNDADQCARGTWTCAVTGAAPGPGQPQCQGDAASPEQCGGGDEDCDGASNEEGALGCTTFFRDHDDDGYGKQSDFKCLCAPSGEYRVSSAPFDCDDGDDDTYPGAEESCNDRDDDCDGTTDEPDADGCDLYYKDGDGDDFGVGNNARCLCDDDDGVATGHTTPVDGDCDDTRAAVNPDAAERCDGIDNDCDQRSDDDDAPAQGCATYWYDNDGDTYGAANNTMCRCQPGAKYTATRAGDCCDLDDRARPGQSGWYPSANGCGTFDYDCADGAQPENPGMGACDCPAGLCTLGGCTLTPGWGGLTLQVPACGASGQYITSCGALCLPGTATQQQRCR